MNETCQTTPADPARHEPSQARTENCTCCGGTRQPDPTDDFILMLKELAQDGMKLSKLVVVGAEEAVAEHPAAAETEAQPKRTAEQSAIVNSAILAHQRATRSIRLCMALAIRFHNERLEREKTVAAEQAKVERVRRERRKSLVERVVRQAFEQEAEERETEDLSRDEILDDLEYDLAERLDEEDIELDLDRPISELVARILGECGIKPEWDNWQGEHWAKEEARRQTPGSPYADPLEPEAPEPKPPEPVAEAAKPEEPKPPEPEPDDPYEIRMRARLARALASGAWMHVLQTDPMLAAYVWSRLNKRP